MDELTQAANSKTIQARPSMCILYASATFHAQRPVIAAEQATASKSFLQPQIALGTASGAPKLASSAAEAAASWTASLEPSNSRWVIGSDQSGDSDLATFWRTRASARAIGLEPSLVLLDMEISLVGTGW